MSGQQSEIKLRRIVPFSLRGKCTRISTIAWAADRYTGEGKLNGIEDKSFKELKIYQKV